ncbi:MAG: hypothetical protein IPP22_09475 [Nitrosomonas sp.]|nr:hypothetical protein [Nitrosomonas sp.]
MAWLYVLMLSIGQGAQTKSIKPSLLWAVIFYCWFRVPALPVGSVLGRWHQNINLINDAWKVPGYHPLTASPVTTGTVQAQLRRQEL